MGRNRGSILKFSLGIFTGLSFVLFLSPTTREICKEKISEAVEVAEPYAQKCWARLLDAIKEGKEAALKKEEELGKKLQSMEEQESFAEEEPPDYIV
ncbi:hypothetical protein [Candidatus Oleimmundimicrobium sp.]|uniref:hypothetical protein n=1 Tax=Candidatus Oleimmundimicrobium sp. TaxID=3060597 RepID=UPI00271FCFFA|nr:hypothetical protein [Candidatus Oleimmundimicrobium sp.]MDO8886739.1 hypothetical protein [Candidatus Oleimmundimicrobium sp.]